MNDGIIGFGEPVPVPFRARMEELNLRGLTSAGALSSPRGGALRKTVVPGNIIPTILLRRNVTGPTPPAESYGGAYMFGNSITLFRLFGFNVRVDASWLIIAFLITWSLASFLFPQQYHGLSIAAYWTMGIVGAVGLFMSIVFHEFFHSFVARRYGLPMEGITLFIFGGVAQMEHEPETPKVEFLMSIAGPLSSIVLGVVFWGLHGWAVQAGWPVQFAGVVRYLGWINLVLAGFNMVPAFPLDGGRVLRSILWSAKKDLVWATRISSQIGSGFGWFLVIMGILVVIQGNFFSGFWFFLIGMFLRWASGMSYQQIMIKQAFSGEPLRRFMKEPVTVPPDISITEFVENYLYKYDYKMYPILDNGTQLRGCITTGEVKRIPRDLWNDRTVGDIISTCSPENTISPDTDVMEALSRMNRTGTSRLMVVEDGRLAGIVSLKDLLHYLSVKMDLGRDVFKRV